MSYGRQIGLTWLFSFISIFLFGQSKYNLPPKNYYERATIGLTNFQKMEITKLSILTDSLQYEKNGETIKTHLDKINYIRVKEGSRAKEGALIGAGSMLVISFASILQVESDPNHELKDNAGGIVALFTLGGAAVGGLIGAATQKHFSYYVHASTK
jgi:hypothetical protein